MLDSTYLPFSDDELKKHFLKDADRHLNYYRKSVENYQKFLSDYPQISGIPLSQSKGPRKIEKDERFWVATALKNLFESSEREIALTKLLSNIYGQNPPFELIPSWYEYVSGDLKLYFEVQIPSPHSYVSWLRSNLKSRQLIPYVLDAANRNSERTLEGPTHVDAVLLNCNNGFALFIEGKVLSDASYQISFDNFRNQIARNIDVMLEDNSRLGPPLSHQLPEFTLFALLTPEIFKKNPESRLYGWLMREYSSSSNALARDLPHRDNVDWKSISRRIGWFTFENIESIILGSCRWLCSKTRRSA